jgi:hypothetical protein
MPAKSGGLYEGYWLDFLIFGLSSPLLAAHFGINLHHGA